MKIQDGKQVDCVRDARARAWRVVSWVAVALWCAFIFYMSAKVAVDSDAISGGLINRVLMLVFGGIDPALAGSLNHPVRKLAHFSEYTVLGLLLVNALACTVELRSGARRAEEREVREEREEREGSEVCEEREVRGAREMLPTVLGSWVLGVLYAASDEFHQLFVPGRSGQLSDVCIDASGVLLGVLVALLVWRAVVRRRERAA